MSRKVISVYHISPDALNIARDFDHFKMDRVQNRFAPGAGTQPPELAGREEVFTEAFVVLDRILVRNPTRSQIFFGLQGVGKTVLLNRIRVAAEVKGL